MQPSPHAAAGPLKDRAYSRKEVVEIIRSVLGNIDQSSAENAKLHKELSALAAYIESMRSELAQLRSIEISHNHIPTATDELDAVVEETAKATGAIMDACEKIEKHAGSLPAPAGPEIAADITAIYEACGFQDITGQRITKVVRALKNIEAKVSEIVGAFGHVQAAAGGGAPKEEKKDGLLNGPQLGGPASSQEEIDALLASFDK
ncbi:MAG: protein phosphatase CheZ [Alphaproteobacteria bacterium]|nr:protein phosphatase CheZ [Alphaproteobacteria bacterium]MDE2337333.1 protein phosphatase CheZ [Alphaproteobacteria bacterium]